MLKGGDLLNDGTGDVFNDENQGTYQMMKLGTC